MRHGTELRREYSWRDGCSPVLSPTGSLGVHCSAGAATSGSDGELDPAAIAELEAGPGLWIGGLHLHICGARRPGELMLMRLLARKGGAFNYHRLDPRIRLIVVSHPYVHCVLMRAPLVF